MRQILRDVCERTGITEDEITHKNRLHREVVRARDEFCWLARRAGNSSPAIGRFIGRDHATVLAACKRYDAYITSST